jgi:tRNA(Arg) A34 adenosine deaminase TadA
MSDLSRRSAELCIGNAPWVESFVDWERRYGTDQERMALAVALSRENVRRGTGGPFGAAIFESESGRVVAVGTNGVLRLQNCILHAEVMAIMQAQHLWQSFTLRAPALPAHELVSSCEPCAMCLGATLWSGVRRLVYGALREDALRFDFDEGPVFPESYAYLARRDVVTVGGVLREEAREVLELYARSGGAIYNG